MVSLEKPRYLSTCLRASARARLICSLSLRNSYMPLARSRTGRVSVSMITPDTCPEKMRSTQRRTACATIFHRVRVRVLKVHQCFDLKNALFGFVNAPFRPKLQQIVEQSQTLRITRQRTNDSVVPGSRAGKVQQYLEDDAPI